MTPDGIRGGQGREPDELRDDAKTIGCIVLIVLYVATAVLAFIAGQHFGGAS